MAARQAKMTKSAVSHPARPRLTRLCRSSGTIKMA
jgi:hypothetical protein